jgi:hypothetical protein
MTETSAFSEPLSPEFQDVLPTSTESSTKETPGRYHLVLTAIQERDWESLRALSLLPGGFGEARVEAWSVLQARNLYPCPPDLTFIWEGNIFYQYRARALQLRMTLHQKYEVLVLAEDEKTGFFRPTKTRSSLTKTRNQRI